MMSHACRPRTRGPALSLIAALVLLLSGPIAASPAPPLALDLPTILELVARESRTATTAAAERAASEAAVDRARASWWPTLDLSAQYLLRDNPIEARAGTFTFPTAEQSSGQYAVELRELVWDGGRRGLTVDTAARRAEAVRLGGEAAIQSAQVEAVDTYLDALELRASAIVLALRLEALDSHLQVVRDLFEQGLTARNDVLETEVRVRTVEDQVEAVRDREAVARQEINRRLGRDPAAALVLPDSLPAPPALGAERDTLLVLAVRSNLGLQAAAARVDADSSGLALARRAWWPSVFVGASHAYVENEHLVHETVNSVMAGLTWNVFDGGARGAEVRQAEARAAAAERDRLETERALAVTLDDAWRRWGQAHRELVTARTDVAAARENLRIVADQYQEGLARSSDVLDAETLLARSRFDVVRRHYATYRAQVRLLATAGRDLAAFYRGAAGVGKD